MAGKGGRRASRPSSGWRVGYVLGGDIRHGGAPAEGHRVLELVAEDPEDVDDPVLPAGRQSRPVLVQPIVDRWQLRRPL